MEATQQKKNVGDRINFQMPGSDQLDPEVVKQWMDNNDMRLRPHVVSVPKSWRKAVLPKYRFPRDCFARAIYFIHQSRHVPNCLYVLGETAGGGHQQHGWVEIDDRVVFDGVMQEFYDKAGYYSAESATPWYRFTRPAVMFIDGRMGKNPSLTIRWDRLLRLPLDPLNPLLVDLDRVKADWKSEMRPKA